jgi:monoamine oxidase
VAGLDFRLSDARNRLGGRILSLPTPDGGENDDRYDLGPAWFWPDQPRIHRLLNELDLAWFDQMSLGNLVVQEQSGEVRNNFPKRALKLDHDMVASAAGQIDSLA